MKRSKQILFSAILLTAITSCSQNAEDNFIKGDENGTTRDTIVNQQSYRHYHGGWYPIIMMGSMMNGGGGGMSNRAANGASNGASNGMISPSSYKPATTTDISSSSFRPARVKTGGFGRSSYRSSGG